MKESRVGNFGGKGLLRFAERWEREWEKKWRENTDIGPSTTIGRPVRSTETNRELCK